MSKRNRENRARKQKVAAQKRRSSPPNSGGVPPMPPEFADPQVRRRFAILLPFIHVAQKYPYTPDVELPDGSFIVGANTPKKGYIRTEHVAQIIVEAQKEIGVTFDEIISVIVDAEQTGLIKIVEAVPGAIERGAAEYLAGLRLQSKPEA
jgi:hypothetical protein